MIEHNTYNLSCPCVAHAGSLVTGQSYQDYIPVNIEVNCTGDEATLRGCSVNNYLSDSGSGSGSGACLLARVSCYSSKSCVKYIHALTQIVSFYVIFLLTPNSPTNVEITGIDSSSIRVTWSPPDMSNCADVDEYRIICYDYFSCVNSYDLREESPSHLSSVTLYDPYDDGFFNSCTFYCCVSGNNSAGEGPQNCVVGRECSLFLVTFLYCYKVQLSPPLQEMLQFSNQDKLHC